MAGEALLVGLGNPGSRYARTRHNVGFDTVERVVRAYGGRYRARRGHRYEIARLSIEGTVCHVVKPLTFMNASGDVLPAVFRHTGTSAETTIVVCDNIDLAPGVARLRRGGSSAGNNGLRSVISRIGSAFRRIYIGIGRPPYRTDVIRWVLSEPDGDDGVAIEGAIGRVLAAIPLVVTLRDDEAMNQINAKVA